MDDDRLVDITVSGLAVGPRHDADVYELAFLCWIESDRKISRAMRRFDVEADEGMMRPGKSTWYEWAKEHHWAAKADEAVAVAFPGIRRRQMARLVILNNRALDFDAELLAGEHDHDSPGIIASKVSTSTTMKQLGGLGTAASQGGDFSLKGESSDQDADDPVDLETARAQAAASLANQQARKGRG